MKDIIWLLSGIIGTVLFVLIRKAILRKAKQNIFSTHKLIKSEGFNIKKFVRGMIGIFDGEGWGKDLVSLFNIRKIVIYFIILSCIFGYGYWKGQQGKPIKVDIGYGKEAMIQITPDTWLHITKDGSVYVEDNKGNKLKQVSVKDIQGLKEKLAPYGFELKPIGVIGWGLGESGTSGEAGAGLSIFRYWQMRLDTFLTNKAIYIGTSYKLNKIKMPHSSVGIAVGKGFKGDNRVLFYYRWEF